MPGAMQGRSPLPVFVNSESVQDAPGEYGGVNTVRFTVGPKASAPVRKLTNQRER